MHRYEPLLERGREHMLTNSGTILQEPANYSKETSHWMSLSPQLHSCQQGKPEQTLPSYTERVKADREFCLGKRDSSSRHHSYLMTIQPINSNTSKSRFHVL